MKRSLIILICALIAWAARFWPSYPLRDWVLDHFHHPPYRGVWAFIPHVFLYTTLGALTCAVFWIVLSRKRYLPPIDLGRGIATWRWGLAGAAAAIFSSLAMLAVFAPPGTIHWISPDWWLIAGNFFSNFYEEFIYRGFLLTALTAVCGFWPATVLTSIAFAAEHTQFPLPFQILIAANSVFWCWIRRRTRTLWAPYLAHEVLDLVMDSLVK